MKKYDLVNNIFEPLGYIVFPHRSGDNSNVWNLYVKDAPTGIEYFGTFEVIYWPNKCNGRISGYKVFTGDSYVLTSNKPELVIETIDDYNKTRIIPAYCCDPEVRPFANIERTFIWYMKTLGFVQPRWDEYSSCNIGCAHSDTMVLKNLYGETISHITMMLDDFDKESGSIVRSIGRWGMSWTQSNFKNAEEMIASINSVLEPELLVNAAKLIGAQKNLTNDRSDNISLTKVDNSMSVYTMNAKNAIKKALTAALENID